MKQGSNITNLTGFKDVLILISTWHYSDFFHVTFGEEIISRRNFFKINLTIHDSKIKEIYLCDSIGSEFYFCDWFLLLLDFYYRLTPDSFKGTNFYEKIFNTFFETFAKNIQLFLKNYVQRISQERTFTWCHYFRIRFN